MKHIGIFGGTFDPIHFGHLNLAIELKEKRGLDEIWFIPAQLSPHKTDTQPTSAAHRLEMLGLALQDLPDFKIKDIESKRAPPSFTVETIRQLLEESRKLSLPHQYYLLLGEDAVSSFFQWHLPEEIIQMVPLLVGSRRGEWQGRKNGKDPAIEAAIEKGWTPTRIFGISSTDVRERLKRNLYCGHLVPASVLRYIKQNQLYESK